MHGLQPVHQWQGIKLVNVIRTFTFIISILAFEKQIFLISHFLNEKVISLV
jgi:hypothetical protein